MAGGVLHGHQASKHGSPHTAPTQPSTDPPTLTPALRASSNTFGTSRLMVSAGWPETPSNRKHSP